MTYAGKRLVDKRIDRATKRAQRAKPRRPSAASLLRRAKLLKLR